MLGHERVLSYHRSFRRIDVLTTVRPHVWHVAGLAASFVILSAPGMWTRSHGRLPSYIPATIAFAVLLTGIVLLWRKAASDPVPISAWRGPSPLLVASAACMIVAAGAWHWIGEILANPIDPNRADMLPVIDAVLRRVLKGHDPYAIYHVPWEAPLGYGPVLWVPYFVTLLLARRPADCDALRCVGAADVVRRCGGGTRDAPRRSWRGDMVVSYGDDPREPRPHVLHDGRPHAELLAASSTVRRVRSRGAMEVRGIRPRSDCRRSQHHGCGSADFSHECLGERSARSARRINPVRRADHRVDGALCDLGSACAVVRNGCRVSARDQGGRVVRAGRRDRAHDRRDWLARVAPSRAVRRGHTGVHGPGGMDCRMVCSPPRRTAAAMDGPRDTRLLHDDAVAALLHLFRRAAVVRIGSDCGIDRIGGYSCPHEMVGGELDRDRLRRSAVLFIAAPANPRIDFASADSPRWLYQGFAMSRAEGEPALPWIWGTDGTVALPRRSTGSATIVVDANPVYPPKGRRRK